ncbi:heat-shock protein Hsp70 [Actinoplanes sp. ATCC 53533]|uniref:Hsp70 family protein n=1 Tax=Actinoplanes sp. ATCC 53533 TaxID=1288362 RepID=UPI000F78147D|nr:Hsp70 family protein [Actinoplanes sp. ATCC 53533]RSM69880.1 heat-shock protein Hsp70 [Actinoplanes sp. ATCC 53533]
MSIDQGRHSLGVDFGTSNTVAVARWPDGRARPILVDGSPLLPSAVYAEAGGHLIAGRDAVHSARRDPGRFEPNPKRRIDDGLVLLGDEEFPVVDMIAAVLVRVADEWHRTVGPVRPELTLTCPATWGATRRGLLAEAAARAGLSRARLVAEPVAAATYFAEVLGRDVPIGSVLVVHDFGAGTFDVSVVARTAEGFEVLAVDGRDDLGGLDIDAALVEHIGKFCAERDAAIWQRLTEPGTLEDRRAKRQLWDDVRIAKERLSRLQSADVVVPLLDLELHVTRDELEELARPVLDQTVQVTRDLLRWADLADGRLAGVFLVGGASRIPLVATLLHRALGEAPVVIEQPELVVAEGSILADAALLASEPAAPGPTSEMWLLSRQTQPPPARPSTPSAPASAPPLSTAASPTSPAASPAAASAPRMSADDMETVPSSRDQLLPPPAVDPWPHAQQHWVPDPEQTVASDPSWDLHALPKTPPPPTRSAAAAAATQPVRRPETTSRPVSPSATRPMSQSGARSASGSVISRPVSPPARPAAGTRPGQTTQSQAPRKTAAPRQPAAPRRRRTGGALRFFQVFLSVLVLVTVPLAAMVAAYGVSAGVSVEEAAGFILDDLRRLLERV